MKRIRIGKDIEIHWPILTNGQQVALEGRDLKLFVHLPSHMDIPVDFTTEGNTAIFTISGTMQKSIGVYRLTMWENLQKSGQTAVDYCKAFELVPTTLLEGGEDESNLITETINLEASSLVVGLPGESAYEAFKKYCEIYPTNATLLVDTYNVLKSGVPNAIRAFNEVLRPKGITKCGIRLDSGDMAYLTREARKMLDAAGWTECQISASNSLDEYIIQDLLRQGAQIDMFGVGERMITARSEPVFGGVYKLAAIEDDQGNIIPKIKVSENVNKITTPHFKKVYRLYDRATGKAEADYLTVWDEQVDDKQPLELFDPRSTWKRKTLTDFEARPLQVPVFLGGKLVYQEPTLQQIQAYCKEQVDTLWDEVKRFENPHNYYVDLSQKLWDIKQELLRQSR